MSASEAPRLSRSRELLIGRLRHRKTRIREGLYLAEGVRCAHTVLDASAPVRFAIVSRELPAEHGLRGRLAAAAVETVEVEPEVLVRVADTKTPQGVLLVCEQPRFGWEKLALSAERRYLVLDGVQDPGNVGTLVRVADALALDGLIALEGTVDPYNAKSVRASAGTVAALPPLAASWVEAEERFAAAGIAVLVAGPDGQAVETAEVPRGWALVLGNEGAGVRPEILQAAAARVTIAMRGHVDSLNVAVAGSILLYALTRGIPAATPEER